MKEVIIDFNTKEGKDILGSSLKSKTRKSYPSDPAYKKRYKWWISKGFGPKPARWAASWRLGEPRRTRNLEEKESKAIELAIDAANMRKYHIQARMSETGETRRQAITELDKRLQQLDIPYLMNQGYTEEEAWGKVQSNIFKEISPD